MSDQAQSKSGGRRELRIAPVMTGGTSLAVWIGGVTAELYSVVNRSPDRPEDDVYGSLLTLTETDAVVDVITGTSAGGLNGVLLSAAWALGIPTERFVALRDTWQDLGSIGALLRKPSERNPPSLLRGDDYFWPQLTDVLESFERDARISRDARAKMTSDRPASSGRAVASDGVSTEVPFADLVVTVTTLNGEPTTRVDDLGQQLNETRQAHHLRFTTAHGDFGGPGWAKRLGLAARTSASIPGVFEASFLPAEKDAGSRPSFGDRASFDVDRWAVDGGVLANMPLGPAIDRIFARDANSEIRRVALYVNPTPSDLVEQAADDPKKIPSVAKVLSASLEAPRNQGIANDIDRLREHNVRVARSVDVRLGVGQLLEEAPAVGIGGMASAVFDRYRDVRTLSSVRAMLDRNAARGRGDVDLDRRVIEHYLVDAAKGTWFPPSPDMDICTEWCFGLAPLDYACSTLLNIISRAYRLPVSIAGDDRDRLGELRLDVHGLLDRLAKVRSSDEDFWADALDAAPKPLEHEAASAWAVRCYTCWPDRDAFRNASEGNPTSPRASDEPEHLGENQQLAAIGIDIAACALAVCTWVRENIASGATSHTNEVQELLTLTSIIDPPPAEPTGATAADDPIARFVDLLHAAEVPIDYIEMIGSFLRDQEKDAADSITAAVLRPRPSRARRAQQPGGPAGAPPGPASATCVMLRRLLSMHVVALVLGDTERKLQPVDLVEVSWNAKNALDDRKPAAKVAGTEFSRLGAFVNRSWRANDWMWGRLDGSYQLILLLLDPERLRQLGRSRECVMELLDDAGDGDDRRWVGDLRAKALAELKFLEEGSDLPVPRSLPVCAEHLARKAQTEIAVQELPHVYEAVRRTSAEGGADGDGGAFRRAYEDARTGTTLPAAAAGPVLRACRIGDETASNEIGHDTLTRTGGAVAVVAANMATGDNAGIGLGKRIAAPLRQLGLVTYVVTTSITTASKTGIALSAILFGAAGALVGAELLGADINAGLVFLSFSVLVIGLVVAMLRSGLWPQIVPLVVLIAIGLAIVGPEISTVITDAQVPVRQPIATASDTISTETGALTITITEGSTTRTEELDGASVTVSGVAATVQTPAVERPPWKDTLFLNTWSLAFIALVIGLVAWSISLLQRSIVAFRSWRRGGPKTQAFPIGAVFAIAITALIWWLVVTTRDDVFRWLVLGDPSEPGRKFVIDTATTLSEQKPWVVVGGLVLAGVFIGVAWDRSLGGGGRWLARMMPGQRPFRRADAIALAVAAAGFLLTLLLFWLTFRDLPDGFGYMDFQQAGSGLADFLTRVPGAPGAAGDLRSDLQTGIVIDLVFAASYSLGLFLILTAIATFAERLRALRLGSLRIPRDAFALAGWAVVVAFVCDETENVLLLIAINLWPQDPSAVDRLGGLAEVFGTVKFAALGFALVVVLAAAVIWCVAWVVRRAWPKRPTIVAPSGPADG